MVSATSSNSSSSEEPTSARRDEAGKPDSGQSVVKQSDKPVDVPRTPKPGDITGDVASELGTPQDDESVENPWADRDLPAPNAPRVRRHYT